jgi:hypothetical protein
MSEDSILQGLMNELAGIKHQDNIENEDYRIARRIQLIYACPYETIRQEVRKHGRRYNFDWEDGDPDSALIWMKKATLQREMCRTGSLFPYKNQPCFKWPWFRGVYYHPEDPRGKAILRVKELDQITNDEEYNHNTFEEKYGRKPRVFFKPTGGLTFTPFHKEREEREKFLQQMVDLGYVSWKPKEKFGPPAWPYPLESHYFSLQLMSAAQFEKNARKHVDTAGSQRWRTCDMEMLNKTIENNNLIHGTNVPKVSTKCLGSRDHREFPVLVPLYRKDSRSPSEIHRDWINKESQILFGEKSIPTEVPEKYKEICYKYRDSLTFPKVYGL